MTWEEYENKCYDIQRSYYAKDIGEENGTEGTIYCHPEIDGYRIEVVVNNNFKFHYFRYIRSIADDEFGIICRIRLDKPEYVYHKGDTILNKKDKERLINILHSKRIMPDGTYMINWNSMIIEDWSCYLWYGGSKEKPTVFPPMPDYSKLPTSD